VFEIIAINTRKLTMRFLIALAVMALLCSQSVAASLESDKAASSLGNVLANEEACQLVYNQAAIATWIEQNVAETDMEFPEALARNVRVFKRELADQSPSERTAHCVQVRRVAKTFGFIE
jgi:hypothetical protein